MIKRYLFLLGALLLLKGSSALYATNVCLGYDSPWEDGDVEPEFVLTLLSGKGPAFTDLELSNELFSYDKIKSIELKDCAVSDAGMDYILNHVDGLETITLHDLPCVTAEKLDRLFEIEGLLSVEIEMTSEHTWPAAQRRCGKWTFNPRTQEWDAASPCQRRACPRL